MYETKEKRRLKHLFGLPIDSPGRPKLSEQVFQTGKALETAARKFTCLSPNFRGAGGLANYTIRDYSNATPTPDLPEWMLIAERTE